MYNIENNIAADKNTDTLLTIKMVDAAAKIYIEIYIEYLDFIFQSVKPFKRAFLSIHLPTEAPRNNTVTEFARPLIAVSCIFWSPIVPKAMLSANAHIRSPFKGQLASLHNLR